MAWKPEVITEISGKWHGNSLCFATREEAELNVADLMMRWDAVRATRVVETEDAVNVRWSEQGLAEPQLPMRSGSETETAIVIASGRSVQDVCLPLLRLSDAKIIAVNKAVHYADFSDYVFTLDTTDLNKRFHLPWFRGGKIAAVPRDLGSPWSRFKNKRHWRRPDIRYLDRVPFSRTDRPNEIMTGCSGFGAFQFAYKYLGARRVFLFGCDHDEQGTYFHGEERDARHNKNWDEALTYWNSFTKPDYVESWNVSPKSRIECLPKICWKIAFRMLGLPVIPIVTVLKCGGEFNEGHVEWLQRQVCHPIICLTDSKRPMKDVVSIPLKHNWPGWWSKLEMFRSDQALGNFLYVDLDTVFLNGIPWDFLDLTDTHVLSDLYGHPWMASGLMFLHHSARAAVWNAFISDPDKAMRECGSGGDQIFISRFLNSAKRFQEVFPRRIVSYKAGVLKNRFRKLNAASTNAQVVCFHGNPRPWDVNEPWIPKLR